MNTEEFSEIVTNISDFSEAYELETVEILKWYMMINNITKGILPDDQYAISILEEVCQERMSIENAKEYPGVINSKVCPAIDVNKPVEETIAEIIDKKLKEIDCGEYKSKLYSNIGRR